MFFFLCTSCIFHFLFFSSQLSVSVISLSIHPFLRKSVCLSPVSLYLHPLSLFLPLSFPLSSFTLSFSLCLSASPSFFCFFPLLWRGDRCLIEWWMSLYYALIELPALRLAGALADGLVWLVGRIVSRVQGWGAGWLSASGGWQEWRPCSPSVSSHTHTHTHTLTQTYTLASDEPPPPIIPAFLLTSHTREWCECYRVHMLLWILINYVDGPNINYKHFYDCWHFALAVVTLYFCPAWCYSTELSHFKHLPPPASPEQSQECIQTRLISHTRAQGHEHYMHLHTWNAFQPVSEHAQTHIKRTNIQTHTGGCLGPALTWQAGDED